MALPNTKVDLIRKVKAKEAVVGVVGLGYVGLPFAVEAAKVGFRVVGIDQNHHRTTMINRGENYIDDVDGKELEHLVQKGLITAETGFSSVPDMDVVVICVPTPLTKNLTPDLSHVESVTRALAPLLRQGQLVSLESTTYPGTTEEVLLPALSAGGLKVDEDFYLCHSPERVDPGNKRHTTKNTTKVVGGVGAHSLEVAVAFYSQTIETIVPVSSAKAAEFVKVFENTFRAVNVALVNEMTLLCDRMDLNTWEVLSAAFTKPFGIMPFYPGPGVGGHCIPLDPHYLEWKAKEYNFNTRFISLAGEINRKMPEFVREKAFRVLSRGGVAPSTARVLVLGVTYKRDINDWRESPSIEVIRILKEAGVAVDYHDPYVSHFEGHGLSMVSVQLTPSTLATYDLVIVATDHTRVDYEMVVSNARQVLDTRNATKALKARGNVTLL